MFSDTFSGIAPRSAGPFIAAQVVGAGLAFAAVRFLWPQAAVETADLVVVPHHEVVA
jgi:arsenate reductase